MRIMQNLQPFETDQVHFNLGTMFRDGIGTSRNLIASYSWFSLAQAAGDVRATPALLNLEQVMKPTEVAEAQRLLSQAEIDDSLARLGIWRALLALAAAQGDLTGYLRTAGK